MKKNLKLAAMLVAASILGSAATMMATSELQKKGVINDTYVLTKESNASNDGFVKTTTRTVDMSRDFTDVAENTINCVVSIKNYGTQSYQNEFIDPFEFFFGPGFGGGNGQRQRKQQQKSEPQLMGSGSGVIISPDGYIVTNNHVIANAEKLEVTLNDNRQFNATVIGTDEKTDIALIKINAKDLHAITFGNSDAVKVGQWCVAVGNPFGFNSTVTAGIISAKARGLSESNGNNNNGIKAFIQHDAAVNPGNSGGALVNTAGELIGINTMIYSQTGNYSGCSFAVPSNTVKKVITDIKQYGTVQRAVLGIQYSELTAEKAKEEKITATTEGIYVAKVTDRSAAMEAGLREGDVIVKLNGARVKDSGEMQEEMNKLRPGDKAEVEYYRDNKLRTTMIYVTHDQTEAMTMGDRIVVMKDGVIQQVATPSELYDNPNNIFVAGFIGTPPMNFFDVEIQDDNGNLSIKSDAFTLKVPQEWTNAVAPHVGRRLTFGLRPEHVGSPSAEAQNHPQTIAADIEVIEPMGSETYLYMKVGDAGFIARVDPHRACSVGDKIDLAVMMDKAHLFNQETTERII